MADKATQELERIYTIPLRDTKSSPRNHRTDRAVRFVKAFLRKHMKAEEVWIDLAVNERLWERGMYEIPSKIRVRAVKFDDGVVEVSLPEAEIKASIRGELQARREKAEKVKDEKGKKEEKPAEEKADAGKEKPVEEKADAGKEKPAGEKVKAVDEKPAEEKAKAVNEKPAGAKPAPGPAAGKAPAAPKPEKAKP